MDESCLNRPFPPSKFILSYDFVQALLSSMTLQQPWSMTPNAPPAHDPQDCLEVLHLYNMALWQHEDRVRQRHVSDEVIVAHKRAIDHHNLLRHQTIELLDSLLLDHWAPWMSNSGPQKQDPHVSTARMHSETPGMMIDRLSIMTLKIHALETLIASAPEAVPEQCLQHKASQLIEQQRDLGACLDRLWIDISTGQAYFKLYRQHKLYHNPRTNPVLRAEVGIDDHSPAPLARRS
jgi:hypothetical protein